MAFKSKERSIHDPCQIAWRIDLANTARDRRFGPGIPVSLKRKEKENEIVIACRYEKKGNIKQHTS